MLCCTAVDAAEQSAGSRGAARAGLLWVLGATVLWGLSSACLARLGGGAAAAPFAALGGALSLLGVAALRGAGIGRAVRERGQLYVLVGAIEALNLATYLASLSLGPLPLMVALHLCAPILLLLRAVLRRERRPDLRLAGEALLIGAAVAAVSLSLRREGGGDEVMVGAILALLSAAMVAVLIVLLARSADGQDPQVAGGLQLSVTALILAPVAITAGGLPPATALQLVAVGALLMGPGFALYWLGLRAVRPAVAGVAGLTEAPVAAVAAALAFGTSFPPMMLVACACVLAAVALAQLGDRVALS